MRFYETPIIKNPSVAERTGLTADAHIWKYGDRLYKLADQYYNDSRFWWVIAWFNNSPTESHLILGDVIFIPSPLERLLYYYGV